MNVKWIKEFFEKNGKGCNAVVGISGGKDSSIVAALCVEALGKDKVIGVLMPNGKQSDIDIARRLVKHLEIRSIEVNIKDVVNGVMENIENGVYENGLSLWTLPEQTKINLPARI